jgi:hypothetical protein
MKLKFLTIILGTLLLNNCSRSSMNKFEKYKYYQTDSAYLVSVINKWIKKEEVREFEHSRFFLPDSIKGILPLIQIDTILYNVDKTKMFSIIIIQRDINTLSKNDVAEYYSDYNGKFIWDARSVVGYKDSINGKWNVSPWMPLIQIGFTSKESLSENTRLFYFNEVKNRSAYAYQENDSLVMLKYSYNVSDSNFWSKCFLWKQGLAKSGYYNFQLDGIVLNKTPSVLRFD